MVTYLRETELVSEDIALRDSEPHHEGPDELRKRGDTLKRPTATLGSVDVSFCCTGGETGGQTNLDVVNAGWNALVKFNVKDGRDQGGAVKVYLPEPQRFSP